MLHATSSGVTLECLSVVTVLHSLFSCCCDWSRMSSWYVIAMFTADMSLSLKCCRSYTMDMFERGVGSCWKGSG